ncbi:MAG: hypothetical protein HQK66_05500 [Desulfamplus sp.]|nr:hypothetical protein [Desulfamplus sp.]
MSLYVEQSPLKIVVCIKSVMDKTMPGKGRGGMENMELNPFDWPALSLAHYLAGKSGGSITLLSMGPENATFGLHQAMAATGAERIILIRDPAMKESDTYVTAKILGTAIKKLSPFDLILFGTRSSDSDTGHVGPQTAEMVELPFIANIHGMDIENRAGETLFHVERKIDGFMEAYTLTGPALFTVSPSLNARGTGFKAMGSGTISLLSIEDAFKRRDIEFWDHGILGLEPGELGLQASPTKIVSWDRSQKGKKCSFIEGSPGQKAALLAQELLKSGLIG